MLSSVYSKWMGQLLVGPVSPETKATCDACAMLPGTGSRSSGVYFHEATKCCTFEPVLVNYRVGLILSDDGPEMEAGRRTVEDRLRRRISVTPRGLDASERFRLLYKNAHDAFGRAPDLGCAHQIEGRCGIWLHRPSTCATWFCKHVRGKTGHEFWRGLDDLFGTVDSELSTWCALEMGIDARILADLLKPAPLTAADLGGKFPEGAHRAFWGEWFGREEEFFRGCAERVLALDWDDVLRICGTTALVLSDLIRWRHEQLESESLPQHPRSVLVQIEGVSSGQYQAISYSPFDPIRLSPKLMSLLPHFDGRPTGEILEEIQAKRGVRINPALVRRMADFGLLVEAG